MNPLSVGQFLELLTNLGLELHRRGGAVHEVHGAQVLLRDRPSG